MDRSVRAAAELSHATSHDFSAPLRHIAGYLGMLEQSAGDRMNEEERRYIARALEAGRQLEDMSRDLTHYLRAPLAGGKEERQEVPLREVIDDVLDGHRRAIAEASTRVEIGELPSVMGKRGQLTMLFEQLVDNALKFRRAEGRPHVRVRSEGSGGSRTIAVEDDGIGIPSGACERVFGIFRRAVAPSDNYPGTGIGLALCRQIAEDHGGSIRATSELGAGTIIHVELPAAGSAGA